MNDFVSWLNSETERRGCSLRQIAQQAGVSRIDITRVAKGQARPSADFCRRVALVLNVSPVEVFRRAGFLPCEPEEVSVLQEVTHLVGQLPPDQQNILRAFVQALLIEEQEWKHLREVHPDAVSL